MKIFDRLYWCFISVIVITTVVDTGSAVWGTFVAPLGGFPLLEIIRAPAAWFLPHALMISVLSLMWLSPGLSFYLIMASLAVAVVATLALPAWFYISRRSALSARAKVLAGIVIVSILIKALFGLLP